MIVNKNGLSYNDVDATLKSGSATAVHKEIITLKKNDTQY
jgi:hypothetical protein